MKNVIQKLLDQYEKIFYRYPKTNLDIKKNPPGKITVFLYSTHGDIALASSFTQFLKNKYKNILITFVTSEKCQYTASLNPDIDKIVTTSFPKYWTYANVEKIKKNLNYDIFINASFYPNLRYLIPFMPLIEVPFFLFRDKPDKIPVPRLKLDFKPKKENYIVLNFEAGTLGWHKNMINDKQTEQVAKKIISSNPKIKFIINKRLNNHSINNKKVKIFGGNFKQLIRTIANSSGVISVRSGINDVLAAATSVPQFVIYPDGNFPDDDGIPAIKWSSMKNLGYKSYIEELIINKNSPQTIQKIIDKINNYIKIISV